MSESTTEQKRKELLRAYFMGNVREDIELLGLNMKDVIIITLTSMVGIFIVFLIKFPFIISLLLFFGVVALVAASRWLRWIYRIIRFFIEVYSDTEGEGEDIGEYLDIVEDGWMYRSDKSWNIILKVEPPQSPSWEHNIITQQREQLGSFENMLRVAFSEKMTVEIHAEQIPDFRYELWDHMHQKKAASEGIKDLRQGRLALWETFVDDGFANTSEYTMRLTINDVGLVLIERDDEPEHLSKSELKRFRTITAIREKVERVMSSLEDGGHTYSVMTGYHTPEVIGRFWDYYAWLEWKRNGSNWTETEWIDEPEHVVQLGDAIDISLLKSELEEERSMTDENRLHQVEDGMDDQTYEAMIDTVMPSTNQSNVEVEEQETVEKANRWHALYRLFLRVWSWIRLCGIQVFSKTNSGITSIRVYRKTRQLQKMDQQVVGSKEDTAEPVTVSIDHVAPVGQLYLNPTTILTSAVPSGKSFLAVNIGVASALESQPVTIIDLSPDQGTITVLNSLLHEERMEGWRVWTTSRVSGLEIWVPTLEVSPHPAVDELIELIKHQQQKTTVIIDMPWSYPDRDLLSEQFSTVNIIDSDYHHWLQTKRYMDGFKGELWMNQVPTHMVKSLTQMIRERWDYPITAIFPVFQSAAEFLLQGTPLAIDQQHRSFFVATMKEEMEVNHENTIQTSAESSKAG